MSRRVTERIRAREAQLKPIEPKLTYPEEVVAAEEPVKKPKPKKSK